MYIQWRLGGFQEEGRSGERRLTAIPFCVSEPFAAAAEVPVNADLDIGDILGGCWSGFDGEFLE